MSWVNLNDLYATKSELATKVPTSRTINGKALSSNVTLAASDIKLSDSTTLQSAWNSISPTTPELQEGTGYKAYKFGRIVVVSIALNTSISDAWGVKGLATFPSDWEPIAEQNAPVTLQENSSGAVIAKIDHGCSLSIQGKGTAWRSGWVFTSFSYITVS